MAVLVQGAMATSNSAFRVRNVQGRQEELSGRRRKLFLLAMTFSQEGEPIDLPAFRFQVFPTNGTLTTENALEMERALEDYLKSYFGLLFPQTNEEVDGTPQFVSVDVSIQNMSPVTSDETRRRQLQRQGTEFNILTTLRFVDSTFPAYGVLNSTMQDAMVNNFDQFLTSFLPYYATTDLADIDSGKYISGFTDPPTFKPTAAPTAVVNTRGSISEVNENLVPADDQGNKFLNPIYPAVICGVAVFILTAIWLSYRRKKGDDYETGADDLSDIEHVSVDFDGRQEALEMERERLAKHRREQEELERQQQEMLKQKEITALPDTKNRKRPWHITGGPVQSVDMNDGKTRIYVQPGRATYADVRRIETPMILNAASSTSIGSFIDDGSDLALNPTASWEVNPSESWDQNPTSSWEENPSTSWEDSTSRSRHEDHRIPLPSMGRGGARFGMQRGERY